MSIELKNMSGESSPERRRGSRSGSSGSIKGKKRRVKRVRRTGSGTPVRFGDLLSGIPALLVASVAVGVLVWSTRTQTLAKSYTEEASARLTAKNIEGSIVCLKRLATLSPERPEFRHDLAISYQVRGDLPRAEALMRSLAPEEGDMGFPLADFWLGQRLLMRRDTSPVVMKSGENHLLRFIQLVRTKDEATLAKVSEAKALLGSLYADTGRTRDARPFLDAAAGPKRPDLLLKLAYVAGQQGDAAASKRAAEEAQKSLDGLYQKQPNNANAILMLAEADAKLGDYTGAVKLLTDSSKKLDEKVWRRSLASLHAAWADSLSKAGKEKGAERFGIVEKGLKFDPNNRSLLFQLGDLLNHDKESAEKARATLRGLLVSGQSVAIAHFALGSDAFQNGRRDEARSHWEQACRADPNMPELANNLAWLLAYQEPSDPARALTLIDEALTRVPTSPLLRGTRGQILVKLSRWKEAISDLELALQGGQKSPLIHAALADSYEHIGMKDVADAHRKAPG